MNGSHVGVPSATPYERDGRRERTYAESYSPTRDTPSSVTRTRTYRIFLDSNQEAGE